jgi:dipeptidyl aminopeptidase/acylaminoacyl peptidase
VHKRKWKMKARQFVCALMLMVLAQGLGGFAKSMAQETAPLSIEQALRARKLADFMPRPFSPDGKWLAYTIQENRDVRWSGPARYMRTGVSPWSLGTKIEIVNVGTGETEDVSASDSNSWLPTWSPNGRYLAFLSDRQGGDARLWIWDRTKGDARRVSDIPVRGNEIEWTPDGKQLVVTTELQDHQLADRQQNESWNAKGKSLLVDKAISPSPVVYDSSPSTRGEALSSASNPWDLDIYRCDLTAVDASTGAAITLVQDKRIMAYSTASDGSAIAYTVAERFEKASSQQILFELRVVRLSDRQDRPIALDIRMAYDGQEFTWSPSGKQLAYRTGGMEANASNCYLADLRRGTVEKVTDLAPSSEGASGLSKPLWDAQGDIYFIEHGELWSVATGQHKATVIGLVPKRRIVDMVPWMGNLLWTTANGTSTVVVTHDDAGKQDGFYRVSLRTGESAKLTEQEQCYTCAGLADPFSVSGDGGYVAYAAEDAAHGENLWMSPANFEKHEQLTHLNPQFEHYKLGRAQLIHWLSDDGDELSGALLLPSDYRSGVQYPLIVWVYGGARLSDDLDHFGLAGPGPLNMQLFATRGYAVFLPDAPQHLGTPLTDLARTVLPGVNEVVEMGVADPHRLAVAGHSYGGYSVLSLIVQTGRFKAAAELDGFADLVGDYGEMGEDGTAFGVAADERGQGMMGEPPWEDARRYVENSPIFYLNRVMTPLLMVHGANDVTVAPFLGDEIFVGLRRLGKEAQYVKYEDEGHSPLEWSYQDQADLSRRLVAWFRERLGNNATSSEDLRGTPRENAGALHR